MEQGVKNQIRIIYSELEGYLESISDKDITNENVWSGYNNMISKLEKLTQENYSRFKVSPRIKRWSHGNNPDTGKEYGYTLDVRVKIDDYKTKLNGIIKVLKTQYDLGKENSNSENGNFIFNISQNQSLRNDIQISIINELINEVDKVSQRYEQGSKEKSFLDRIKENIPNAKNTFEIIMLIFKIAKEFGFSPDKILKIFS